MGAIESTMRWTPYGPTTASTHRRKASDVPTSPGNSTSNLTPPSHDGYDGTMMEEDEDLYHYEHHNTSATGVGIGVTSSGVLMGANAPPLYDACLIGRWDEVLAICGVNDPAPRADGSHGSEAVTEPTCSSSEGGGGFGWDDNDKTRDNAEDEEKEEEEDPRNNNAALQTRYTDRRRNTPLHLACRRQPPVSVIKALLNHSPCEAVSARTADGLTPLHFASYCGAGSEVVGLLVDRMRSDAAVGRAVRLSTKDDQEKVSEDTMGNSRWRTPSDDSLTQLQQQLPPTRLFDRRRRTPLHCACTGFRTPTRPAIVRKLLSVDPASATLADERGRTPLSLLFDDYAEEVMEALEDDVSRDMARRRIGKGGELHECWKMLEVLLQAAYLGSVSEDDAKEEAEKKNENIVSLDAGLVGIPQDRPIPLQTHSSNEVNVMEMQKFSMVHAAAAVWETPPPLAKLVLKCLCGEKNRNSTGNFQLMEESQNTEDETSEWDPNLEDHEEDNSTFYDAIQTPDEENMRLPLHIAVCARPQDRSGARIKHWLSSSEAHSMSLRVASTRRHSSSSLAKDNISSGVSVTSSLATRPDIHRQHRVYNPRFGRSRSRDGMAAFATFPQQNSFGSSHGSHEENALARSSSSVSMIGGEESFLMHTMVRDVLALYPEGASVVDSRTGKLPIVLAIENGKSWETAVGPLLDAFPKPFAGDGDGGMALPDDSKESVGHRKALRAALLNALTGPESFVREETIRTAGKLSKWGGIFGMVDGSDQVLSEWLDKVINSSGGSDPMSPEGIIVGPGATASVDKVKIQTTLLSAVAEVLSNSRAGAVSDRIARQSLDVGREFLFSKDSHVREASARVLGSALDAAGDSDDASTVMREIVLNICNEESSVGSVSVNRGVGRDEDAIAKHGKLLALTSILSVKHGSIIMGNQEICDAAVTLVRRRMKDKNTVVRAAAYRAIGPVIGKSPTPADPKIAMTTSTLALKELRSDILKGTRATEQVEVQLALARGLISASKIHPCVFLCKAGMPIMDAALMLAMSTSTARPNVQKAFQIFLWVALQIRRDDDFMGSDDCSHSDRMSGGLEKYIELAEGDNGGIMMTFVQRVIAKMENVDEQYLVL